ncbi:hypothetical protein IIB34_01470 [PVC group bacterium]|nr:hypothetical protein [PVC group bacterium]
MAPGSGEQLPRVEPTDAGIDEVIYGICVGGDANGTYGGTSEIAGLAGDSVKICVNGRCKARVDGSGTPIAIGSPLSADTTDGVAVIGVATAHIFARAQQVSTSTDFIAVFVDQEGIF